MNEVKPKRPTCPRCEQGEIHRILIHPLSVEGYLCEECYAFWLTPDIIGPESFVSFSDFLQEHGLRETPEIFDDLG